MNEPAFIFFAKNSQLAHCGHIGKISLFMMRLAIIRYGQGGTINDHIRLNLLKKTLNVRFIPYICFNETIFPCIIRKNIRMQRAPRYLILCMNRQIIQYLASGESIGADNQYLLH